jgi:hypothetical protein
MFSETDFKNADISCKLNCVIMDKMDYPCTKPFRSLTSLSKKNEYNKILNTYINKFDEEWKTQLDADFNAVVSNYMSGDDFKCENETVAQFNSTPVLIEKE